MTRRIACLHNPGMRFATAARNSSSCQCCRGNPSKAALRVKGCGDMRQRVAAAFGSPARFFSAALCQRRMTSAVTPLSPAQSCKRREAFSESA